MVKEQVINLDKKGKYKLISDEGKLIGSFELVGYEAFTGFATNRIILHFQEELLKPVKRKKKKK